MKVKKQIELKTFFSYFGSKYRIAKLYPKPKYDTIVEPFAGSAGYSLRYPHKRIILNDIDSNVTTVWNYLIHVSEEEILSLPDIKQHIDEVSYLPFEAQLFIRFWLTKACGRPRKTLSKWVRDGISTSGFWGKQVRKQVASQLQYIRHWEVLNTSYEQLDTVLGNIQATWFIDPPYEHSISKEYAYNTIDYYKLALWIHQRKGESIVCEKENAHWLPFNYLTAGYTSHNNNVSHEVFYHYEGNK